MRKLRINFDTFGDQSFASSRLRAYALAAEIERMGHQASIRGSRNADIQVFQKVRNPAHLAESVQSRALVVYDFDDHYLLEDVGTRQDVLRFLAFADVVTVGSHELVAAAREVHPQVYLFENPLDIGPELPAEQEREWRGRIGWFGNPCNLPALYQVDIPQGVTTVTKGGDVEWSIDTVDQVVAGFDLVLIPVLQDQWTLAKNANRLLKAIALGVPVLASRTPEHERTAQILGLPDSMLVPDGGDWRGQLEAIRDDYPGALQAVQQARSAAFETYGIARVAERWLTMLAPYIDERPARRPMRVPADCDLAIHAVIENPNEPERLHPTLASLDGLPLRSLSVVSAQPVGELPAEVRLPQGSAVDDQHRDFFDTYASVSQAVEKIEDGWVLLLRAGAVLTHGFLSSVAAQLEREPEAEVLLFHPMLGRPRDNRLLQPPRRLHELLAEPQIPHALLVRAAPENRLRAAHGPFAVWELLIRCAANGDERVALLEDPVVLIDPTVFSRHPLRSYYVYARDTAKPYAEELPHLDDEWERLSHTLHAQVVEAHRELFRDYARQLIPGASQRLLRARRFDEKLREKLTALEAAYAKRKREVKSLQEAYDKRKAEVFDLRSKLRQAGRGAAATGGATRRLRSLFTRQAQ